MERYGSIPLHSGQAKPNRPRFNLCPLTCCLFGPWMVFVVILLVRSFKMRHKHLAFANTLTAAAWLFTLCVGFFALDRAARKLRGEVQPASWMSFTALTMLLAALCGTLAGEYNYQVNMLPYLDVAMLQTYLNVDPVNARGEHLMDAGRIVFTKASHLDIKHSMGFMDTDVWCVAPVTTLDLDGNSTVPAVVDFWAIGKNCCAGSAGGDFRCGSWSDRFAHGGLRLLDEAERPFYRLAVQQAEAAFKLQVLHPIFLHWMPEPVEEVEAYRKGGHRFFQIAVMSYFCFHFTLVFAAVFFVNKVAQW